jgi:U3 small nucleolar RNA-associated protein 18
VAGRRGAVSVLDWSTAGVGAVVAELKSGRGGAVCGMTWSLDGRELSVLGGRDGAEVEVWNVGERRIVRKWGDDRAYGGSMMVQSRSGEYTAIG